MSKVLPRVTVNGRPLDAPVDARRFIEVRRTWRKGDTVSIALDMRPNRVTSDKAIADNAGMDGAVVAQKVKEGDGNFGYNALTHEYGDMMKMGVIVPTKVERTALQNAASIASLLLTTDAIVSELKEEKPEPAGAPGGGMY